ncbi:MAG TPA: thermonuclease family protein [Nitrososphaeraceae archaeon]|nr:thermonuclease family protein [Nitrososphaeraceae archaeon]
MYNSVFVCNVSINLLTLLLLVASSLSIILLSIEPHEAAFARCPNGYHVSPDGDCEKATVSSSSSAEDSSNSDYNIDLENIEDSSINNNNDDENYNTNVLPSIECQGQADCFKGKVTGIVDGDTLDINNIRVRLTLVNTPERGEAGYTEAREFVKSVCRIGTDVLVDEDDGQKEGSYDRLIGLVYCVGDDNSSNKKGVLLNEVLLQRGYAVVFEEFCDKSEFSNAGWVQEYGC